MEDPFCFAGRFISPNPQRGPEDKRRRSLHIFERFTAQVLTAPDTATKPSDYDHIFTGDLGTVGTALLHDLLRENHVEMRNHHDCGLLIYDRERQDVHAGGSGCGCSAGVLCGHILNAMERGELQNILFIATGALMSTTSSQQGESIPGIAHLIHLQKDQ